MALVMGARCQNHDARSEARALPHPRGARGGRWALGRQRPQALAPAAAWPGECGLGTPRGRVFGTAATCRPDLGWSPAGHCAAGPAWPRDPLTRGKEHSARDRGRSRSERLVWGWGTAPSSELSPSDPTVMSSSPRPEERAYCVFSLGARPFHRDFAAPTRSGETGTRVWVSRVPRRPRRPLGISDPSTFYFLFIMVGVYILKRMCLFATNPNSVGGNKGNCSSPYPCVAQTLEGVPRTLPHSWAVLRGQRGCEACAGEAEDGGPTRGHPPPQARETEPTPHAGALGGHGQCLWGLARWGGDSGSQRGTCFYPRRRHELSRNSQRPQRACGEHHGRGGASAEGERASA